MDKRFLAVLLLFSIYPLRSDMVYDPVSNIIYSTPQSADINNMEYYALLEDCCIVGIRASVVRGRIKGNLKQMLNYLKRVGTPTALRLIKDLKRRTIYFPDGSICRKI